jgi:hypothetical protein
MPNNHADFNRFLDAVSGNRSATIFDRVYTGMPDIPYKLGIRLFDVIMGRPKNEKGDAYTEADVTAMFCETIDHSFGNGTFDYWVNEKGVSSDFISLVVAYIRSGFDSATIRAATEKAQVDPTPPLSQTEPMMSSETTGMPSMATSDENTALTSSETAKTSPGSASSGSSEDSLRKVVSPTRSLRPPKRQKAAV